MLNLKKNSGSILTIPRLSCSQLMRTFKLFVFSGSLECRHRTIATADRHCYCIVVGHPDLSLVLVCGETELRLREFVLLDLRVGGHAVVPVIPGQFKHGVVEGMEAGQGDELEPVSEFAKLRLEGIDLAVIQVRLPVERRRTVIGQRFARKLLVHGFGEPSCLLEVRLAGLTPYDVTVGGVGQGTCYCLVEPGAGTKESLRSPFSGQERPVPVVDVRGD